jgi:hypothetical protein
MKNDATLPTKDQLENLLEKLLPPNEEMDQESASIILEREGVDRNWLAAALRSRLERRVELMRVRGETIPPDLLKIIATL